MRTHRLPNYLRTYRKRLGFSQDEVAFLLGVHKGAKVCRHERYQRRPALQTALSYEVVFQIPARELFRGFYQKVEQTVKARAAVLGHKLSRAKPSRLIARKLAALKTINQQP